MYYIFTCTVAEIYGLEYKLKDSLFKNGVHYYYK